MDLVRDLKDLIAKNPGLVAQLVQLPLFPW